MMNTNRQPDVALAATQAKLLVVDDEQKNLYAMRRILQELDIEVIEASSGQEALELGLHHEFCVVLMDVQMPDMDGFETATLMREDKKLSRTPIIFVTAINQDQKFITQGYETGGVDYLLKPIEPELLESKVRVFWELYKHRKALESKAISQEEKLKDIGRLAAGIIHDIQTPVNFIMDNTNFLQDVTKGMERLLGKCNALMKNANEGLSTDTQLRELGKFLNESELDYMVEETSKAIADSLEGLDRVSKIVLSLNEYAHHGGRGKKVLTDLNSAIKSIITITRNEWKEIAEFITDLDPSLPKVFCFKDAVSQVILNMVINASHAISDAQRNIGEKGRIQIHTSYGEETVVIKISDTGTGIPEGIREKIFDQFFTTKEIGKGTGQGLALAYNTIVEKSGGTIDVESQEGKGTTFIIHLPLK